MKHPTQLKVTSLTFNEPLEAGEKSQKQGFYFLPILYYTPKGIHTYVSDLKTPNGDPGYETPRD